MFDDIVERYDLLNRLLSLGSDTRWRRTAVQAVQVRRGQRVLDLGCGAGELGAALADRAEVVGLDVSERMLGLAQRRLAGKILLVRGSAFQLPFPSGTFDAIISGFVLRNLRDLDAAFAEMARILVPGGRIALLDATRPRNPLVRRLFGLYFGAVAPALGTLVGKRAAYRYLVRSLAHLPGPTEMCCMLTAAGFQQCAARPLTVGTVTLFTAVRGERECST